MSLRCFTRLTNAFSKKLENHCHALALYFVWYNFARLHKTLRVTPAMEAGLTDHVWTMADIAELMETTDTPKPRGPYNSMIKFFVLDVSLRRAAAVSTDPAPDGAFAPSFLGGPRGQLP
jgi:hypothetical protein